MGRTIKRILIICLLAVFLVSTLLLLTKLREQTLGAEAYDQARQLLTQQSAPAEKPEAQSPETLITEEAVVMKAVWVPEQVEDDPYMDTMAALGLADLQKANPDVIGWISIPDSKIDYPLLQSDDNSYYLMRTWDGKNNSMGSIFMEYRNSSDLSDENTVVYGHNMRNGTMFASLKDYSNPEYWKAHPYIYISDGNTVYRYEIFSCYRAELQAPTYSLRFKEDTEKEEFLSHALKESKIQTNIIPSQSDRILTLSTCFGDGTNTRWVVQARLKMVEIQVPA